jgi:hypothetical protein
MFINLTETLGPVKDSPIWVNTAHVQTVAPSNAGSVLRLVSGDLLFVTEDPGTVILKITRPPKASDLRNSA